MTIAVPVAGDLIYQHFGHAPCFRLYQIEHDAVCSSSTLGTAGHGHDLMAQLLTDHHVTTVICGCIGCGAKDALKAAGITLYGGVTGEADEAVEVFRKRYNTIGKFENTPYPGIRDMLADLKQKGFCLLVATSKPEHMAIEILEHFELAQYFDRICGASLDRSRDTKEKVIEYLLQEYANAEDMVMVGDTAFDVVGAAYHHIPCIGVTWGYGKREDIAAAGAVSIVDNVAELQTLLEA